MTLKVVIRKREILVFKQERFHKTVQIEKFPVPYSIEQFRLWYDITNQTPRRITFECEFTHRKLCMLTRKKFEEMKFPEFDYVCRLLKGEVSDDE